MNQDTTGIPIRTSKIDEDLMMHTLGRCYGARHHGFHVSIDHYKYLAEQIVSLRVHIKRLHASGVDTMSLPPLVGEAAAHLHRLNERWEREEAAHAADKSPENE